MAERYQDAMVRFLEGTEGFSEYKPQNIGMDFDARVTLSAMRTARMMINMDNGASIFIDAVDAAEQRFWAYLRVDKLYLSVLRKHNSDPRYKLPDYKQKLDDAENSTVEREILKSMEMRATQIELMKAKEKAFVIMIWSRYAGLDITSQAIPETILPEAKPDAAKTPEELARDAKHREKRELKKLRKRAASAGSDGAGPPVQQEPELDLLDIGEDGIREVL